MNPDTGIKTWQWVVTVIVVVVLIIIGVMIFGNKSSQTPADNSNTGTNNNAPTQGTNNIIMSDQYPGNVVYLSSVQLDKGGWVVIHKDNNGQPGAVIGETYVPAGVSPAKVTVSQPIIDGGTYYAMLHSDNGDQKFDETVDLPLKDANGNIIMRVFHGSVTAGNNLKG